MKARFLLYITLAVLYSCNKVNADIESVNEPATLTAVFNEETKTLLKDNLSMSWQKGDKLRVIYCPDINPAGGEEYYVLSNKDGYDYTFTNESADGSSAVFKCSNFKAGGFVNSDKYIVADNLYQVLINTSSSSPWISGYDLYMRIKDSQVYNPNDPMGLQNGVIPLFGKIYGNEGCSTQAVSMRTPVSIIRLYLSNNTGSDQKIGKITLYTDITGATNDETDILSRDGIAGCLGARINYDFDEDFYVFTGSSRYYSNRGHSRITLKCNGVNLPKNSVIPFSFVVAGGRDLGNITWTVYNDDDTPVQIGKRMTATLNPGYNKVYSAKRDLTL